MIGMIRTLAADIGTLASASAPASASAVAVADSVSQILVAGAVLPAARHPPLSALTAYHCEKIKSLLRSNPSDPQSSVAAMARQPGCPTRDG